MIGPYGYDPRSMRFRSKATGRFVKASAVKSVTLSAFDRAAENATALGRRLQAGEISLGEWQLGMAREVKNATLYASALANGGWAQLSQADYGRAGQWLAQGPKGQRGQYEYLRDFARQIEAGLPLDGRFLRRSAMYIHAGNQFYERERGRIREQRGFDEVRNVRHARDSCTTSAGAVGCIEMSRRGWMKVEDGWVPPGARSCLASCRCSATYRNSQTGEIAA